MSIPTLALLLMFFSPGTLTAQEPITKEDYQRALSFSWSNLNNKKIFNHYIHPNWFPDSTGFWFVNQTFENKRYLKVTFPDEVQSELFDHQKLSQILSDSLDIDIQANDLPIDRITYQNPSELLIRAKHQEFVLNTQTYAVSSKPEEAENKPNESTSPDNKWVAFARDHNLYLRSTETEETKPMSTAGKKGYEYATYYGWADIIEGENGDRPEHFSVSWSRDSKWIMAPLCDLRSASKMYLLDWSVDTLYKPKLLSYYRGSPGDTTMIYTEPVFFHVETGKELKTGLPRSTTINSIDATWSKTPGKVFLKRMTRGYQNLYLYTFDLHREQLDTLYKESSETNIDNFTYELAENSNRLFFLSEKSGWRQLYSLNLKTKKDKALTSGAFYIDEIVKIDEPNERIFFRASGREAGRNPYHQHLYSISFDGKNLKLLTPENLNHDISMSPDCNYFVDNMSTLNTPTKTLLRSTKSGQTLMTLGQADISRLENWTAPEAFTVLAHDGVTTIYGALWKPSNFDPSKRYPVIDASYTGPHTQLFPRRFSLSSLQQFAELGFIMVVIDGLGSCCRSKQFHDYSYKNLGGGLEDHIGAIRQLAQQYSWIDTTRVGIYGHSAGGYDAAHALLQYPDFYKVAVASSGDHDHRMEKAWWPEMYMGWPVDSAYHLQSNITMAGNLKGKLLITHGGIDENVNPSASFKLAEALIKADKQFDMLILPSQRHGYRGDHWKYFTKVRWNYFIRHLRGTAPIWDFEWE